MANTHAHQDSDPRPHDANDLAKVLSDTDIEPLENNDGELQATHLGYPSKLVSKWYYHDKAETPIRWGDSPDHHDASLDIIARDAEVPIVHRYQYSCERWITHTICIQDSHMQEFLRSAFSTSLSRGLEARNWTFSPPYMSLVHEWERLKSHYVGLRDDDESTKNAAAAVLAFFAPIIASPVLALQRTKATGQVAFDQIWQIFPREALVTSRIPGVDAAYKVFMCLETFASFDDPGCWTVYVEDADWDDMTAPSGTKEPIVIDKYEGYKEVVSLPVVPQAFQ